MGRLQALGGLLTLCLKFSNFVTACFYEQPSRDALIFLPYFVSPLCYFGDTFEWKGSYAEIPQSSAHQGNLIARLTEAFRTVTAPGGFFRLSNLNSLTYA